MAKREKRVGALAAKIHLSSIARITDARPPERSYEADLAVRASVGRTGHTPELLANALTHAPGEVCDRTLAFLAASKNERVREEAKCAISERAWRAASVEATARIERFVREGAGSDLFYASSTQIRDAVTLAFEGDAEFVFDRLSAFTLGGSRSSEWLANAIVAELQARAAAAIRGEGPPPDPRWRAVMNPRDARGRLARHIAMAERALAYLAGEHRRTRLAEISLSGDDGGPARRADAGAARWRFLRH